MFDSWDMPALKKKEWKKWYPEAIDKARDQTADLAADLLLVSCLTFQKAFDILLVQGIGI